MTNLISIILDQIYEFLNVLNSDNLCQFSSFIKKKVTLIDKITVKTAVITKWMWGSNLEQFPKNLGFGWMLILEGFLGYLVVEECYLEEYF